jgi:hypothetical protein
VCAVARSDIEEDEPSIADSNAPIGRYDGATLVLQRDAIKWQIGKPLLQNKQ